MFALFVEAWVDVTVYNIAVSILANEGPVHISPPSVYMEILKVDVLAWIGCIASDDAWWKEATFGAHVSERDVPNINQRLGLAAFKRVRHAASTSTIRLSLLLWTNINAIPDRVADLNIFI